jgi:hypothetical protein
VGQVNGLSVLDLGDYAFGRPSRITARVGLGEEGLVDIEREVKLSGPTHSKGVLILTGYLLEQYARDTPLAVSARLTFEQVYGEVDGDSASSAELYALLSALAEAPIRQGIAVTGSVNQRGEIQAVGGVVTKVEGFFAVCKSQGLDGQQGVIIPATNVQHLMLEQEVIDAVAAGTFHVWAVRTVDKGVELLTGLPAGERLTDGSFRDATLHARVRQALASNADDGDVKARVAADHFAREVAAVDQGDSDTLRALEHVGIGQDQSACVVQHARTESLVGAHADDRRHLWWRSPARPDRSASAAARAARPSWPTVGLGQCVPLHQPVHS